MAGSSVETVNGVMATSTVLKSIGHAQHLIQGNTYARNGSRQFPRFLIAVAGLVGVLATFCAGAQSCGIVQWGAGNGYPPGPYSSPVEACAIRDGEVDDASGGWGSGAIVTFSNSHVRASTWGGTPTAGYPGSGVSCGYTNTITGPDISSPVVFDPGDSLPYVFAILPPASCPKDSATAQTKMTLVSLPGLVRESEVIVYGQVVPTSTAASTVSFQAESVLKGRSIVAHGPILLCNSRDNSAWPDLNTLTGTVVIFASRKGKCFDLSHGYRSIVQTKAGRASTNAIKDQPNDQTVARFLRKIRTVVANKRNLNNSRD
jgi:hypothetical protein